MQSRGWHSSGSGRRTPGQSSRERVRPMESKTREPGQRRRASRIFVTLLAFLTTVCVGLIGSVPAQAAPPEPSALSGNVTGTLQDGTGSVAGLFNVTKFKKEAGELVAVGKFTGTIIDGDGAVTTVSKK